MASYTPDGMPHISCLTSQILSKEGSFLQIWKPRPRETASWTKATRQLEGRAGIGIPSGATPTRGLRPHSSLPLLGESQGNETKHVPGSLS